MVTRLTGIREQPSYRYGTSPRMATLAFACGGLTRNGKSSSLWEQGVLHRFPPLKQMVKDKQTIII
jgi:hypothetical protein